MINIHKLKAKGWAEHEIQEALDCIRRAEESKNPLVRVLDQLMYWIFLWISIAGNIAFSVAMFPLVITLPSTILYVIVGFMGFIYGILCTTILQSIDVIDGRHHLIYVITTPIIGIVNFFIIVSQANQVVQEIGIGQTHSPIALGATYLVLFFLPYFLFYRGSNNGSNRVDG